MKHLCRFIVMLACFAAIHAQTVTPSCAHALRWAPQGAVLSFQNGLLLDDSQVTLWQRTIAPNRWADQDRMSYAYVREIDNPGQIPPSHYSAPIKESQVCTGWNPPIFFSLDSTTTTLGGSATLHLSFTNAIVLTAGLQFTLNYDNTAISAISATPGPSATNAGKTVSCADSTPPGAFTCLITGIPWNNMQDGVAANINVTVATLPTTIRLSALSGSLMGVNLPATIAIPGQVAPSSSGVISAAVALLDGCVCPGPDGSACWISTGYGSTGFWTPAASCAD